MGGGKKNMTEQEKIKVIKEEMKKIDDDSMSDAELIQSIKWISQNLSKTDKSVVNTVLARKSVSARDRGVLIEIYGKHLNNELWELTK
ncbi:MAG TPA: hypothetical protein DCF70_01630 [Treponema sp.]|nr:hypothetical protein [Treponema sp.]